MKRGFIRLSELERGSVLAVLRKNLAVLQEKHMDIPRQRKIADFHNQLLVLPRQCRLVGSFYEWAPSDRRFLLRELNEGRNRLLLENGCVEDINNVMEKLDQMHCRRISEVAL